MTVISNNLVLPFVNVPVTVEPFEVAIQRAIYDKLSADLTQSVFDEVPERGGFADSELFPYVVVGNDTLNEWETDTELGMQGSIVIHTWSRGRGKKEIKELQGAVYDSLNRATLSAAGYNFVDLSFTSSESFVDADGKTRHGIQNFQILIERI